MVHALGRAVWIDEALWATASASARELIGDFDRLCHVSLLVDALLCSAYPEFQNAFTASRALGIGVESHRSSQQAYRLE
jgi:hypothetical protein